LLGRLLPALHTLPASPRQHPASPE
jgi:hypothetical protein